MALRDTDCDCNQCQRSNPFFLHDGEQPGQSLVSSDELLTGYNYHIWLPLMTMALRIKNKLGFVDGTIPKPHADDDQTASALWSCCDSMVMSWIKGSVSESVRNVITYHKSAQAMWESLKNMYHGNGNFRKYQIRSQLRDLKQHGSMDVQEYFRRFITLWNERRYYYHRQACGEKEEALEKQHEEEECLMQFLVGVNQSHWHTVNTILNTEPLPHVYDALKRLEFEESRRPNGSGNYRNR